MAEVRLADLASRYPQTQGPSLAELGNAHRLLAAAMGNDRLMRQDMTTAQGASDTVRKQKPFGMADTWPAKLAMSLWDAAKLPGDVYAGRVTPDDPKYYERAADLAGGVMGGAVPFAQRGAAGIFGGRLAATADKAALVTAERMAAEGKSADAILKDTGWLLGPDKKWRFEISDHQSTLNPAAYKHDLPQAANTAPSGEQLVHDALYAAYPSLANIPMTVQRGQVSGRYFSGNDRVPEFASVAAPDPQKGRAVALHELQHAVQGIEGFSPGVSPQGAAVQLMRERGPSDGTPEGLRSLQQAAMDVYRRNVGEVEARNVEARRALDAPMRRAMAPWTTEDVPTAQQIVGQRGAAPVAAASEPVTGIRAYHGSPHDFDRFDLSRIGTGEGSQAFGHGIYLAENPAVAKQYRDALAQRSNMAVDARLSGQWQEYLDVLANRRAEVERREGWSRAAGLKQQEFDEAEARRIAKLPLKRLAPEGRMYEVNINAKPEQFLDWDKPLGQMGPDVRDRLNQAWLAHPEAHAQQTGGQIYESARIVPGAYRDPQAASKTLRDAGIPGIRYLDQGSRGAGQGSSNYVVFDDKLIDILRKYGLVGAAGPAAGASLADLANVQQQ